MTQFSDDLYMGDAKAIGVLKSSILPNPTQQAGVGPVGRVAFRNIVPLTAAINNIALSQHMTASTALTLTAGAGITAGTAPNGSAILQTDVPRCASLTSTSNLSAINFTLTGYDEYGALLTSTIAGPNNNTVTFPKAVASVVSIVPGTTDGSHNVSVGTSDLFGLQFAVTDAGYVLPKWGNALPIDTGTLVEADTAAATATTGDVRGTYQPSTASNGVRRLVVWQHLTNSQCGSTATRASAVGVAQA